MKAQKPAKGVLKVGDYGKSVWYHIRCDCGNDECSHEVDIEADDMHVQVHTYVTVTTKMVAEKSLEANLANFIKRLC
jgi:hypothetical protein